MAGRITFHGRGKVAVDANNRGRRPFFGFFVVVALVLVCFCPVSFGLSCAGIFYPSLAEHFGVGTGMLSYYSSILQLAALVFLPVLGKLFGRVDARLLVCGACLVVGADFILLANASSLPMFYACSFVMGAGMAVLLFLAPSTLVNRWFKKRAGFFTGIVMAFTGIGGVVWSSVGGMLINSAGWPVAYLAFAAITFAIVPACWLCISSNPADRGLLPYGAARDDAASESADSLDADAVDASKGGNAFKTPAFLFIFALCFLLNMSMYAYFIIPSYIGSLDIGTSMPLLGATAASAAMGGQTAAKVLLGFVGDRHPGAGTIAAIAFGISGLAMLLAFSESIIAIYAGATLFGIQYGVSFVMVPIFTRRAFGVLDYARIYSRVSMAAAVASVAAGLIGGTVIDATGGYTGVFGGIIAISVLALVAAAGAARHADALPAGARHAQPAESGVELAFSNMSMGSLMSAGVYGYIRKGQSIGGCSHSVAPETAFHAVPETTTSKTPKPIPLDTELVFTGMSMGSLMSQGIYAHIRAGAATGGAFPSTAPSTAL